MTDPREFFQAACAAEVAGTKVMPNCSLTVWVVVSLLLMAMAAFGYSPEVLACFKAIGNGWQARMDGVLKDYIAQRSRRALSSTSATA